MKKAFYVLFTVLFFAACLVPSVGLLVKGPGAPAANEVPVASPAVKNYDGTWNESFLTNVRDYVGKGFFLRLEGITAWDTLCARLFHTSGNDDVLIGPDGWLFFGAAKNDISGAEQLSDREIWASARSLYLMQEYAWQRGARFVFTVPCGKYTLYPEHAPDYVTVAESSNRERLAAAMSAQGVNYADLYAAFTAVDEELYWQWDSHWNARGAALAADTILAEAGREGRFFSGGFVSAAEHSGDLYAMLYPTGTKTEPDYAPAAGFTFEHTSNFRSYDDMIITTENPDADGSLLLFRDSSGRNLYPYLAESFGEAYISRMNNYDLTLIEERGADIVVAELAGRTLDYLLKYPAVYPAPERDASVLEGATPTGGSLAAEDIDGTLPGYTRFVGTFPVSAVDSPVYIRAGDMVYEAIPGDGSYSAYLPSDAGANGLQVFIFE